MQKNMECITYFMLKEMRKCLKKRQYYGVYLDGIYLNQGIWRIARVEKHGKYYIFHVERK